MRCTRCKREAQINLRMYNLKLCKDCFLDFFLRRVKSTIEKFKMADLKDKILVAVSGGKDSLSLWSALDELGYNTQGLYIDLGIEGFSCRAEEKVKKFSQSRGLKLKIVRIRDIFGKGIKELAKIAHRQSCRVCGMIRRYIMNQEAKDFDCVATGHTLDDEATNLLGNILYWRQSFLARQFPVLEREDGLRKKIKPFSLTSEKEIIIYAYLRKIDFLEEKCPLSRGATSFLYKRVFDLLEERMPAIKLSFYKEFLKRRIFKKEEDVKLTPCRICGYLTVNSICNFCKLKEKVVLFRNKEVEC